MIIEDHMGEVEIKSTNNTHEIEEKMLTKFSSGKRKGKTTLNNHYEGD
jgi:hypothetical protein